MALTRALRLPKHSSAPRVTDCELATALHHTQRGKAPGPDGVYAEFLRDGLTCKGRAFLRDLIDATIFSGYIPQAWKHATCLPLLKPSRPPEESGSYRPISLTSVGRGGWSWNLAVRGAVVVEEADCRGTSK